VRAIAESPGVRHAERTAGRRCGDRDMSAAQGVGLSSRDPCVDTAKILPLDGYDTPQDQEILPSMKHMGEPAGSLTARAKQAKETLVMLTRLAGLDVYCGRGRLSAIPPRRAVPVAARTSKRQGRRDLTSLRRRRGRETGRTGCLLHAPGNRRLVGLRARRLMMLTTPAQACMNGSPLQDDCPSPARHAHAEVGGIACAFRQHGDRGARLLGLRLCE
jgi:hypothetical protein